jgi:hypothetical protein
MVVFQLTVQLAVTPPSVPPPDDEPEDEPVPPEDEPDEDPLLLPDDEPEELPPEGSGGVTFTSPLGGPKVVSTFPPQAAASAPPIIATPSTETYARMIGFLKHDSRPRPGVHEKRAEAG